MAVQIYPQSVGPKESFISRLKSALTIRNIAWALGLIFVIGSVIYFTGQGGSYKGLTSSGIRLGVQTEVIREAPINSSVNTATSSGQEGSSNAQAEMTGIAKMGPSIIHNVAQPQSSSGTSGEGTTEQQPTQGGIRRIYKSKSANIAYNYSTNT